MGRAAAGVTAFMVLVLRQAEARGGDQQHRRGREHYSFHIDLLTAERRVGADEPILSSTMRRGG
jgi:hypothetical protein